MFISQINSESFKNTTWILKVLISAPFQWVHPFSIPLRAKDLVFFKQNRSQRGWKNLRSLLFCGFYDTSLFLYSVECTWSCFDSSPAWSLLFSCSLFPGALLRFQSWTLASPTLSWYLYFIFDSILSWWLYMYIFIYLHRWNVLGNKHLNTGKML